MATIASMLVRIGADTKSLNRDLGNAKKSIDSFNATTAKLSAQMADATTKAAKLERTKRVLTKQTDEATRAAIRYSNQLATVGDRAGQLGRKLSLGISGPLIGIGAASIKASVTLNQSMANIGTLIPKQTQKLEDLKDSVQDVAILTGKDTSDVAEGLYKVISKFGDAGTDVLAQRLELVGKLAVAGVGTTEDAIDALGSVAQTYGDTSAKSLNSIADALVHAANVGDTTLPQLAARIGKVAPRAKDAGVSINELMAVMATLPGVTGNTAMVTTQLSSAITALVDPTDEMSALFEKLGVESGKALIQQYGFQGALIAVVRAAEASKIPLGELMGRVEGQTLALALAGAQADEYSKNLMNSGKAAGAVQQAFDAQTKGINAVGFSMKQLRTKVQVLAQDMGDSLAPALYDIIKVIEPLIKTLVGAVKWFSELDEFTKRVILTVVALAAGLGPLILLFSNLITPILALRSGLGLLTGGFVGLGMTIAVGGALAIALAGIAYLFYKSGEEARRARSEVDKFAASLTTMKIPELNNIIVENKLKVADLQLQQKALREQIGSAGGATNRGVVPITTTNSLRKIRDLQLEINTLNEKNNAAGKARSDLLKASVVPVMPTLPTPPTVTIPIDTKDKDKNTKTIFEEMQERVGGLINLYDIFKERGLDVSAITSKLNEEYASGQRLLSQQGDQFGKNAQILQGILRDVEQINSPQVKALESVEEITSRVSFANPEELRQLATMGDSLSPVIDKLIEAQGGALNADKELVQARVDLLELSSRPLTNQLSNLYARVELAEGEELNELVVSIQGQMPALQTLIDSTDKSTSRYIELVQEQKKLQEQIRNAPLKGINEEFEKLTSRLDFATSDADKRAIYAEMEQLKLRTEALVTAQGGMDTASREVVDTLSKLTDAIKGAVELGIIGKLKLMQSATNQIIELADAAGLLGKRGRQAIGGINSVIAGIEQIASAKAAAGGGGLLGSIGGIMGLMGGTGAILGGALSLGSSIAKQFGLFGAKKEESPEEKARKELLKRNNDALENLRNELNGFRITARDQLDAGALAARFTDILKPGGSGEFAIGTGDIEKFIKNGAAGGGRAADVAKVFERYGLTFSQLNQIAEANGIQLLDEQGKIVGSEFAKLAEAIGITAQILTTFGKDLESQRSMREMQANIFDTEQSPAADIQRELDLLAQFAPSLGSAFAGLDSSTAEGRAAIEAALRTLFTAIQNGNLTLEQLGELKDKDELLSIINNVENGLDALAESAKKTTDSLTNVPSGFKIALRRFESMAAEQEQVASSTPSGSWTPGSGVMMDSVRPNDAGKGNTLVDARSRVAFAQGSVVIQVSGNDLNADEIFDLVLEAGRRRARQEFGDPDEWSNL